MYFKNRYDAAMRLIPLLQKYKNDRGVVMAVPRGGVALGYFIAKHYNFPMELILTKKIGHPFNSEFAIGAVGLDAEIINEREDVPEAYLKKEIKRIRESLRERQKKFMGNLKPLDLKGKTVIIVDDGIATGNTILASIEMMRHKEPKKIVVAVPVAPPSTAKKIKARADDFICLHTPIDFFGVGQFYDDFSEVSDEEVVHYIKEANGFHQAA